MTMPSRTPTVNLAAPVYGTTFDVADPAELLHEASKLQPSSLNWQMRGASRIARDEALLRSTFRSALRHPARARVALPTAPLPLAPLGTTLRRRRSTRRFGAGSLPLAQIAVLLRAGYGVVRRTAATDPAEPALRTAPSAGALYPLELFVKATRVEGLEPCVYHYDALADELERVRAVEPKSISPDVELVDGAAAILFVAAVFWRSRVKYGLRAYRFTLLEAGHVTQNILLAAAALDLGASVLGGFYDAQADAMLDLDGVDESTLVAVCLGANV